MLRMRILTGAMLMLALLLSSCASGALPVNSISSPTALNSPSPFPTSTPPIPQMLRVTNHGTFTLSNLRVRFPDETVDFGEVPPGATSAYHTFTRGVYRYAAYDVTVDGKMYQQPVVDWVGEQPMEGSAFTYLLDVNPAWWSTEGQVIRLLQVSADPPVTLTFTPTSGAAVK